MFEQTIKTFRCKLQADTIQYKNAYILIMLHVCRPLCAVNVTLSINFVRVSGRMKMILVPVISVTYSNVRMLLNISM